ncbi:mucin-5AC-like isoform X2 [Thalassophryne amazonica]|nr:mucin-5AC-like isoform X2 [Thalassophryne amazonica]
MKILFVSLVLIWVLPQTESDTVTSSQHVTMTETSITVQNNLPSQQKLAAHSSTASLRVPTSTNTAMPSSQTSITIASRLHSTSSIPGDATPTEALTMKPSTKHVLTYSQTHSATTSSNFVLAQSKNSTESTQEKTDAEDPVTSLQPVTVINEASSSTTKSMSAPPVVTSISQSQDTTTSSTALRSTHETPRLSASPTKPTIFISTKTVENHSENQSSATGGGPTQNRGSYTMSPVTTPTTKTVTSKPPPLPDTKANKGVKHGDIVAGVIGGALVLMMVGFLVIFIKKHRFQKQQISTEWAGPSPFLENTPDSDRAALRSSNRISLSSFLPQRLSRRMPSLQELDELTEINANSSFGVQHQEVTAESKGSDDCAHGSNVSAIAIPEMKTTSASEPVENTSLNSPQSNEPQSMNHDSQGPLLTKEDTTNGSVENPAAQLKDGLD